MPYVKLLFEFKAKGYNVNLMNKINRTQAFWVIYLYIKTENGEKITLTSE